MAKWLITPDMSFEVEADTEEEAAKKAQKQLQYWAESNSGSEELANASFTVTKISES